MDIKTLRQLYYNLIFPYLSYGLLCWGDTYKTKLEKISTKQKCVPFFAKPRENTDSLYKILEILTVRKLFKFKISCFVYKICYDQENLPEIFRNYLTKVSQVHTHNTRSASQNSLRCPKIRTDYGKHSFSFSASKIWEHIPLHIKSSISTAIFKKEYKNYLVFSK